MWLFDAAFGVVLASRRDLTAELGGRLGAVALAVGSLLAIIGMDRLGFVSPDQESIFKTLALLAGAFAVQVLGPGAWSLDAFLPVDVLYDPAVSWILLGLAVAGALVAAFLPPPTAPEPAST